MEEKKGNCPSNVACAIISIAFSFFFLIQRFIKLPASSLLELLIDKTIFKPCR